MHLQGVVVILVLVASANGLFFGTSTSSSQVMTYSGILGCLDGEFVTTFQSGYQSYSSFEGVFPMTGLKGSCSNKNTFKAERITGSEYPGTVQTCPRGFFKAMAKIGNFWGKNYITGLKLYCSSMSLWMESFPNSGPGNWTAPLSCSGGPIFKVNLGFGNQLLSSVTLIC